MHYQSQNGFRGIFVGILQNKKGYLIYIPSKCKIVSSHDDLIEEASYSVVAYMSRLYSESLIMQPVVSYIPYAI